MKIQSEHLPNVISNNQGQEMTIKRRISYAFYHFVKMIAFFYYCAIGFCILNVAIPEEIEFYASETLLIKERSLLEIGKRNTTILKKNNTNEVKEFKPRKIKRAVDSTFHGHPKTREQLWIDRFLDENTTFDQTPSLIKLLHNISLTYLRDCTPVIIYDNLVKEKESYLFQNLLKDFPITFVHGYINDKDNLNEPNLLRAVRECLHFMIFLTDIKRSVKVLGKQSNSKVVIVARSSQWAIQEFLAGPLSRIFTNLLVIGQSFNEDIDKTVVS